MPILSYVKLYVTSLFIFIVGILEQLFNTRVVSIGQTADHLQ